MLKVISRNWLRLVALVAALAVIVSTMSILGGTFAFADGEEPVVWDGSKDTEFAGSGTKADPYQITSPAELYGFVVENGETASATGADAYYVLTKDIYLNDISDPNWYKNSPNLWYSLNKWAIGAGTTGFRGHFDGQGHTVYGMCYTGIGDNVNVMGLIPVMSGNAEVTNVNVKNMYVERSGVECYVGGVSGFITRNKDESASNVTVTKCVVDDTVDFSGLTNAYAGGIVGTVWASNITIEYCGSSVIFNDAGNPASRGGGILAWPSGWGAKSVRITHSYSVSAFTTRSMSDPASVSDGTLYSAQGWWATSGGVNLTYVSSTELMKGDKAKNGMPDLGWDVWAENAKGYPIIAGSTAGDDVALTPKPAFELWDGSSDTDFEGSGTEADPYKISSGAELYGFVMTYSVDVYTQTSDNLYFVLTDDIYLNDVTDAEWKSLAPRKWVAVNKFATTLKGGMQGFRGHFDGQGHSVYGLYYGANDIKDASYMMGLIPVASGNAVISNVNLKYSYIAPTNKQFVFGGIVGLVNKNTNKTASNVTVSKCVIDKTVDLSGVTNAYAGGVVGIVNESNIVIEYCGSVPKFNDSNAPANFGGAMLAWPATYKTKSVKITNSYCVDAFTVRTVPNPTTVSDGSFYSMHAYWASASGKVNLTVIDNLDKMQGNAAKSNMPELGWDVWEVNTKGFPIIKGSTVADNSVIESSGNDGTVGGVWSGKPANNYAGGTGKKNDPYLIETPEQLYKMVIEHCIANDPEPGAYYELTADIYLNDVSDPEWYNGTGLNEWYSINLTDTNTGFKGKFRGNGHYVYGMYYKNIWSKGGLIPVIGGNARVSNVHVRNSYLNGEKSGLCFIGGIVGYLQSGAAATVAKCSVRDTYIGAAAGAGGIIGGVSGGTVTISECYFIGDFTKGVATYAGGIYGDSWGSASVSQCYVSGYFLIDKSHAVGDDIRYATVSQEESVHCKTLACTVVSDEDMKGEKAKLGMPDLDWENTWYVVENDYPHIDPLSDSAQAADGIPGTVWSGKSAEDYAGGTGTADDPYQIATGEQLYKMVREHCVIGDVPAYYVITEDIKLNDTTAENWYEGKKLNQWHYVYGINNAFAGHIDGQGHIVSGMYVKTSSANVRAALIPQLDAMATVKNIGVVDSYIDVSLNNSECYAATISAYMKSWKENYDVKEEYYPVISNCFGDESVTIKGTFAGGLVSGIPSPVWLKDCYYVGKIVGGQRYGALIGNAFDNNGVIVENCYACTPDFDKLSGGKPDVTASMLDIRDSYIFGTAEGVGLTFVGLNDMIGEAAKEHMSGLDYENTWMTVENSMPILKVFYPKIKSSANAEGRTVTLSFATNVEGMTIDPITANIGSKLVLPEPKVEGYKLDGWYVYPEFQCKFTETEFPYTNLILYAKWVEDSIVQNFEFYPNSEYDVGIDHEYYRPGVDNYGANNVHGGSKGMHRLGKTADEDEFLVNYEDELVVGAEYKIKFWVMTDTDNANGELSVAFKNWPDIMETNNGVEKMMSFSELKTGEWKEITYEFVAKSKWISFVTTGNTSLYFDDIMIIRSSDKLHDVAVKPTDTPSLPPVSVLPEVSVPETDVEDTPEDTQEQPLPEKDEAPKEDKKENGKDNGKKTDSKEETDSFGFIWIIVGAAVAVVVAGVIVAVLIIRKKRKA